MDGNELLLQNLVATVRETLSPIVSSRSPLRAKLVDEGRIQSFQQRDPVSDPVTSSLAAVDGGRVGEQRYILDILVATADAANGKVSPEHPLPTPQTWSSILPRNKNTVSVVQTAMAALEVQVMVEASHETRILDGSFVTPLIGLREGLFAQDTRCRREVARVINHPADPITALNTIYTPNADRMIIAITKADTSTLFQKSFVDEGFPVHGVPDRTLATQLLKPGEFFAPIRADYSSVDVDRRKAPDKVTKDTLDRLSASARTLRNASDEGQTQTLFFKPHGNPHFVLRLEYLHPEPSLGVARRVVETIDQDTGGAFILEPYSQWKVDREAKRASKLPDHLMEQVIMRLEPSEREAFGPLLRSKHRT